MSDFSVEMLYDNLQEKIVKDICEDDKVNNLWKEINELDELLKNTISKSDYNVFDDYLSKEAELIDLERRKAFAYGYKLSNKLMVDSIRE